MVSGQVILSYIADEVSCRVWLGRVLALKMWSHLVNLRPQNHSPHRKLVSPFSYKKRLSVFQLDNYFQLKT